MPYGKIKISVSIDAMLNKKVQDIIRVSPPPCDRSKVINFLLRKAMMSDLEFLKMIQREKAADMTAISNRIDALEAIEQAKQEDILKISKKA